MAEVDIQIAGRHYSLTCRDGEEDHLRMIATVVNTKANDAARTMGGLNEPRQLLMSALLLADELNDLKAAAAFATPPAPPVAPVAVDDPRLATALERLAERIEALAARADIALEPGPPSA